MPAYSYVANAKDGRIQKGTLPARDEADLARQLRAQNLILISATSTEKKGLAQMELKIPGLSGVKMMDRVLFTRHLQIMIKAGLSITRALSILHEQTENKTLKGIILDLKERVERGQSLTESLRQHPKVFPPLYTSMVEVGEVGGTLEDVLDDLASQLKKDYELMAKVRGAMLYPAVILTVMLIVTVLMLVYVLPQLVEIFREVEGNLPITTRGLIWVSDFVQMHGVVTAIGFLVLLILLAIFHSTAKGKRTFHWVFLHAPILSDIVRKLNLARFARTSGILLRADISIVESFGIVQHVVSNVWYKDLMGEAAGQVRKGVSIAESISGEKAVKLFPPIVRQMVSVGEQTGTLDEVLADLADFYEKDVTRTTDNLSSVIEPVLMVILGLGVGLIAVSVISPIYSLIETF